MRFVCYVEVFTVSQLSVEEVLSYAFGLIISISKALIIYIPERQ